MAVLLQPAPMPLESGHDLADHLPEGRLMMAMAQVAEFMHDHIVEDGGGREDQAPVEVDHTRMGAAAPEPLLILDLQAGGNEPVWPPELLDRHLRIRFCLLLQMLDQRLLDHGLVLFAAEAPWQLQPEAVALDHFGVNAVGEGDAKRGRLAAKRDGDAVLQALGSGMTVHHGLIGLDLVLDPRTVAVDERGDLACRH
ncbi:MAG: hypothetical protein HC871_03570 [Rhizobiales bacterium]|nr:hypothetical protein [Hyphomicrobiales bacterium]